MLKIITIIVLDVLFYLILLLGFFFGTSWSFKGASLAGEHCSSARLPISFRLSLIGDSGVLSLDPPLLGNILSASPGLMGEVGEDGDLGPPPHPEDRDRGEVGEMGDCWLKRLSSLGVRSILILGGPISTDLCVPVSAERDLCEPAGEGDRDRRARRLAKPPLWNTNI